jgi:hypothetical protein
VSHGGLGSRKDPSRNAQKVREISRTADELLTFVANMNTLNPGQYPPIAVPMRKPLTP